MLTKVADLPDRSVRYLEAGEGQPLVLIHGFPFNAEMWLPQLYRPAPGWRFIAPDLRGFRGTGPAFEDVGLESVTIDSYAADVLTFMSHVDADNAVVCGLSMGGYVALSLVQQAPHRVRGLVLANTRAAADSAEGRAGRDRMLELVAREGAAGVATAMLPKLLGESTRRDQPDLEDAVRGLIEPNSPHGVAAGIRAIRDRPDRVHSLPSIHCRTLIICGDEDAIIPRTESEAMKAAIPGAELVVLHNIGHLSNLENPIAFNRALGQWLK